MAKENKKLNKSLGVFDVFAICTGAMFSSGFFLLPGLAFAETGPSVFLAYLAASLLIVPSLLSMAELSTAMPKAGGSYYFMDRALGPLAGAIGGIGTWISLILKSAFALIGVGAYLAIFVDVPIIPFAVAITIVFGVLNIMGSKKTAQLQNILVATLLAILGYYVVQGAVEVYSLETLKINSQNFSSFFTKGIGGFLGTVGMVFVSYAGVTKVASVAEEVRNPDRNIPLGMLLSLFITTIVYVVGTYVMVEVLPANELAQDLTPVATSAEVFFSWMPGDVGVIAIVVAAIAAFVSTGNAGIMSASRYPLAMSRDHLLPPRFASVGKFKTPTNAIIATVAVMIAVIVLFDVADVAKLASAFQLLVFAIINLAVIVMRESHIWSYTPGYNSPLYPWMQIFGILAAFVLIIQIGLKSILFTFGILVLSILWYKWYADDKTEREGAIFHLFARLGKYRFDELDHELKEIMMERELEEEDPYEALLAKAKVKDIAEKITFEDVVDYVAEDISTHTPYTKDQLKEMFFHGQYIGGVSVSHGSLIVELQLSKIEEAELFLIRSITGVELSLEDVAMETVSSDTPIDALVFLISPQKRSGEHIRMLSELVSKVDQDEFLEEWHSAENEQDLRGVFMRHERYLDISLEKSTPTEKFIGKKVSEINLPEGSLLAVIHRGRDSIIPRSGEVLKEEDSMMIIGNPRVIDELYDKYAK